VARAIRHRGVPMSDKQQYELSQTELTNEEKQVLKQRKDKTMADEKSVVKINEGFGKITKEKSAELAATAAASASRAEIESSYVMALKKPRNEDMARTKILDRCKNLRFALKAMYSKPVGSVKKAGKWVKNFIEGPSIRFAEEMLRLWGNVKTQQSVLYDDPYKRIIKIIVIDLESNSSYSKDVTIEKACGEEKL